MKTITISTKLFLSILVGLAIVAGMIGANINENGRSTLRNDYLRLAGEVGKYKTDLGTCQVSADHYKALYNMK